MNIQTLNQTIKTLEGLRNAVGSFTRADVDLTLGLLRREVEALAEQPAQQEPVAMRDAIAVNLVREGINKHRARELADHFINLTSAQPAQQEPAFYRHEDGHMMTPERAKFLGFDLNDLQVLYTSPPAQRKPLTGEEMTEGCRSLGVGAYRTLAAAFEAGVRFAEASHGSKEKNT